MFEYFLEDKFSPLHINVTTAEAATGWEGHAGPSLPPDIAISYNITSSPCLHPQSVSRHKDTTLLAGQSKVSVEFRSN